MKVDWVDERLQNWARWKLASGSMPAPRLGDAAAAVVRDPYADKPIPISDCEASDTDDAVMRLPGELRITVIEYYVGRGGLREKLGRLCCEKATLFARIERAHRLLAEHFLARQARAKAERERVHRLSGIALPAGGFTGETF